MLLTLMWNMDRKFYTMGSMQFSDYFIELMIIDLRIQQFSTVSAMSYAELDYRFAITHIRQIISSNTRFTHFSSKEAYLIYYYKLLGKLLTATEINALLELSYIHSPENPLYFYYQYWEYMNNHKCFSKIMFNQQFDVYYFSDNTPLAFFECFYNNKISISFTIYHIIFFLAWIRYYKEWTKSCIGYIEVFVLLLVKLIHIFISFIKRAVKWLFNMF